MRRVAHGPQVCLEMKGTLAPHKAGPPLHVHYAETEEGMVVAGTLSAVVDGRKVTLRAGERGTFPAGSVHRWWNDGDETLVFEGLARPVVDLDRYLQAVFEVLNSGSSGRPPLFHMAHVAWRHRRTQSLRVIPPWIQAVVLPVVVLIGTALGRYRGTGWPGCPARCTGAPLTSADGSPQSGG